MKIFEVAGEGKLHGLTVMSLDAFVKKEDDVEESQIDEIDRRGFLKGLGAGAAAVAGLGAAGSAMAQTESPGYWANYAAELAEKSIPRITAGAFGAAMIGLRPNGGADFSKMKADIFEKVHKMVTAYCKITNSYKAKEIINNANSNAIKSSQADDPVNRGKFSVKFLIVYRSILEDALEEWKTKGTQQQQPAQKQEQPPQQSTQQQPQEIKLNLKLHRQVGDIVTVNGGVADGKKARVTQILGPNKEGTANKGLGVIIESLEESDMSGIMHAAKNYNKSFLITAELAEGGKKTFRVRAQSERVARDKFEQHHNQARITSVKEEGLKEFAPAGSGDGREPNEEEILRQLAAQWWNGTEQQMAKAQRTLEVMGWEIGQDESGDEDAGVFVIRAGDENGKSYIAFNHSDLKLHEGVAEGEEDLVQIEYWQQETMESGRWVKTKPIPRATAEKIVNSFERGEIVDVEQGVAEGSESSVKILYTGKDKGGTVTISYEPDYIPGHSEKYIIRFDGRVKSEMPSLRSAVYALTHYQFDTFRPDLQPNPKTAVEQGVAEGSLNEAPGDFGLGANYRAVPDDEMQDLMGRSKNKTKTKRDKFDYPYIHGSNIEVKDEAGKKFDTEKLKAAIMTRPASILGQNAKMQHSETGDEAIFDIGLPALKGLAVNEKTGEFVVVDTCPGAGACQTYCYAMKGSYVMFKAVSMGLARMLNFLLNDPEGFAGKLNSEIAAAKAKYAKKGARIVVRWHDAGDFFSPEYLAMAYAVAEANPDVGFYAYTKMGDVANAARPRNFNMNFSQGAKTGQEKKVNITRTKHSKVVPKDMFFDLIARKGNELIKDAKGRMQFASPENLDKFKTTMAQKYAIDKDSILTYDQMMKTPVGNEPKWNVIVMPGDGDNSANRNDVVGSYLLFH